MNSYILTPGVRVEVSYHKTRNGFRHEAVLWVGGVPEKMVKINYLNRTWESFEYQSVIRKAIGNSRLLTQEEREAATAWAWKGPRDNFLPTIAAAASAMSLLFENMVDANRFKTRILRSVPGIVMPADEQQRRLDAALNTLRQP